jgi:sulfite reductase (ferredoxin)
VRVTNRQNVVFRGLTEEQLPTLYSRLDVIGMAQPGAELVRDVVSCPGADTCNLAVTQSRGLADEIGRALDNAGLAEVGGIRINISGCTNSCGQHHVADIGFFGAERRAHGRPAPGYQMLLGGYLGQTQVEFGQKALRLPAKAAAEATVRVVSKFVGDRQAGETFTDWLARAGGPSAVGGELKDLDVFPTPEERPDFYVDFDETGPYEAVIGAGECAGS